MKINEITVGRKFNIGNYESLEIRVSVAPSPDEEAKQWQLGMQEILSKLDEEIKLCAAEMKAKGVSK